MENNCLVIKLKDSVQGDYDKLNLLKINVNNGDLVAVYNSEKADIIVKTEGCTFNQPFFNIVNYTEYTFKDIPPTSRLNVKINGNGYLYIGNKYNFNIYELCSINLDKIYSYKSIIEFSISSNFKSQTVGNINHLLSQCSPNLKTLILRGTSYGNINTITGDFVEINKFTNLSRLEISYFTKFSIDIINFSSLINLNSFSLYNSTCEGNVEELAQAWYNNGKITGTTTFQFENTRIIVPSIITNKTVFYCTFTEDGYIFSQTNPNT